jgi:hypothetical protein
MTSADRKPARAPRAAPEAEAGRDAAGPAARRRGFPFHARPVEEVFAEIGASPEGLGEADVRARLEKFRAAR